MTQNVLSETRQLHILSLVSPTVTQLVKVQGAISCFLFLNRQVRLVELAYQRDCPYPLLLG